MTYNVRYLRSAARQLRKLPRDVQVKVVSMVKELATEPRPSGCRKLAGSDNVWRVKAGRTYRISYIVDDPERCVTITEVAHRHEAYRQ